MRDWWKNQQKTCFLCVWIFFGGKGHCKAMFWQAIVLLLCFCFSMLVCFGKDFGPTAHKCQKQIQDNKFVVEARDICIRSNFDSSTMLQTPRGVWVNSWVCFKVFHHKCSKWAHPPYPMWCVPCISNGTHPIWQSQTGRVPFGSACLCIP